MAFAVIACGGCASLNQGATAGETSDGFELDWDYPIPGGETVVELADVTLPFNPVDPTSLGSPLRIMVTPPDVPIEAQELIWVFEHPEFGRFFLSERLANREARWAEFEGIASQPAEGCSEEPPSDLDEEQFGEGAGPTIVCHFGQHDFATTDTGVEVFATSGDVTTAVHWFVPLPPEQETLLEARVASPAIEMTVIGPSGQFTPNDALTIAGLIEGDR